MSTNKPDYKNWVPKGMIIGMAAGTAALAAANVGAAVLLKEKRGKLKTGVRIGLAAGLIGCAKMTEWCIMANRTFSYNGTRKLAKDIVDGTAGYIDIPDGGTGLDVGCGSGALTIACAKRNPGAKMIGMDRWGAEYASFSKELCESNAEAEGVSNVSFEKGDAVHLDYDDETFDAVTSNYVYHNISGVNRQQLLRESLRVLKKGGTFAIHDIMSKMKYGNIERFAQELRDEGYKEVELIRTDDGKFMSKKEATKMMLRGSAILRGVK
jgi:arsenite methyltransferase